MSKIERIRKLIRHSRGLLKDRYAVKRIGIFGSYAKGASGKASDIDLLVEFSRTPDLFEFIQLEGALKALLGRKIDLVSKNALKPLIRKDILKETIYL